MPSKPKKSRSRRLTDAAFREVNKKTPKAVKRTIRKKGKKAGERQRTAIALAKAARRGARGKS